MMLLLWCLSYPSAKFLAISPPFISLGQPFQSINHNPPNPSFLRHRHWSVLPCPSIGLHRGRRPPGQRVPLAPLVRRPTPTRAAQWPARPWLHGKQSRVVQKPRWIWFSSPPSREKRVLRPGKGQLCNSEATCVFEARPP